MLTLQRYFVGVKVLTLQRSFVGVKVLTLQRSFVAVLASMRQGKVGQRTEAHNDEHSFRRK